MTLVDLRGILMKEIVLNLVVLIRMDIVVLVSEGQPAAYFN